MGGAFGARRLRSSKSRLAVNNMDAFHRNWEKTSWRMHSHFPCPSGIWTIVRKWVVFYKKQSLIFSVEFFLVLFPFFLKKRHIISVRDISRPRHAFIIETFFLQKTIFWSGNPLPLGGGRSSCCINDVAFHHVMCYNIYIETTT